MPILPGQLIDGKYRVVRLIGEGGMGAVFEGENTLIRRRVAIKVLHAAPGGNADLIRRFEREAQAAGEIGSDHILEVLDLGSLPSGDRFMVMEYLDGETLAARLLRRGALAPKEIVPLASQLLQGLASAHAVGIIHRDLKPDNVFITKAKAGRVDFVKIIDFGISKFSASSGDPLHLTRAGAMMGTPCYMSPEQARGLSGADVRSDIYAVGVILYESVTGALPFEAENFNDLMFKIALSDAPPPSSIGPGIDPAFEAIIIKAMARAPDARYQSVDELAAAMHAWATENSVPVTTLPGDWSGGSPRASMEDIVVARSPTPHRSSDPFSDTVGTDRTWAASEVRPERRRLPKLVAGAGGVALLAVVITLVSLRHGAHPNASAGTSPLLAERSTATSEPPIATATASAVAERPLDPTLIVDAATAPPAVSAMGNASGAASAAPRGHPALHGPARPSAAAKAKGTPDFGY